MKDSGKSVSGINFHDGVVTLSGLTATSVDTSLRSFLIQESPKMRCSHEYMYRLVNAGRSDFVSCGMSYITAFQDFNYE